MSKKERQKALRILIGQKRLEDQEAVVAALAKEVGIHTTQAVISRDLTELGVVRKTDSQGRYYALLEEQMLALAVKTIVCNEVLIVLHTVNGLASFVGDQLDASNIDILGCIAGENVVFVSPRSVKNINALKQQIAQFFGVES